MSGDGDGYEPKKFRIMKCCTCGTWLCCYEGGVQGFESWRGAFDYADALSLRPRLDTPEGRRLAQALKNNP
jgi:hypothetical protein